MESERLILDPVSEGDVENIYTYFTRDVTTYMYPNVASNIRETGEVVQGFMEKRRNNTDYVYSIRLKRTGEFIGLVGLHDLHHDIPELGIWTKMDSHGNHYGREAIGAVIHYARGRGIKKLYYPVDRRNIASKKIPLFYGGLLVDAVKNITTPDGRTLEIETYEINL